MYVYYVIFINILGYINLSLLCLNYFITHLEEVNIHVITVRVCVYLLSMYVLLK